MSGHNKWANIKHTKEKQDAIRGKKFTQLGKLIAVAVKEGGSDPTTNARLRDCIAKAKEANMPNDNIQRSIKKASGELGNVDYTEITYEGYGPAGSAVIVNCLTDNKNRTAGEIRHIFDKSGGSMGSTGCVSYMFKNVGLIDVMKDTGIEEDILMDIALEGGAYDLEDCGDCFTVKVEPSDFSACREFLESKGVKIASSEVSMVPDNYVDILEDDKYTSFVNFIDKLEENDDVQDVYHNVNLKEETEE